MYLHINCYMLFMVKDCHEVRFSAMWIPIHLEREKMREDWMNVLKCLPVLVRGVVCDFFLG